ncbi:preprotein translocase subunit YajC [Planctomycetes bacterium Poly30]|uniref:Sec translocon accessory complex subunit YajC n=1 Tax=Saltatorellus ferox TaxID=2528018 RepID=A0A518EUA1_9BACT|nr:preprotein translocase subunit YajC [Planctomycetes bacterium Poly30]
MTAFSLLLDGATIAMTSSVASSTGFDSASPAFSLSQAAGPGQPGAAVQGPATPGTPGADGATGAATPQGNPMQSLMMFALIGAVIWFLIFAPERKARKKREAMLGAVKKGDKIVTTGGLHAEVVEVKENTLTLKAGETRLTFSRASIHEVLQPKEEAAGA